MPPQLKIPALALAVMALVGLGGCEHYSIPNRPLPELEATGLDGTRWTRESFAGRPWVINLWVPGCTACVQEFPGLAKVHGEFGDEVGFLALSLEPDSAFVGATAQRLGLEMPVAIVQGEILAPLGVRAVPSTVFVDAEGRLVAAASGQRSESFFRKRVRALLEAE